LVYQSFRNHDVPDWMATSMRSVRNWAEQQGFVYEFIGDEFFDVAPEWFRQRVNQQRHLVSDYARLILANHYLQQEWERVIWVDADVLIINPDLFLDPQHPYVFCRELWMTRREGQLVFSERVNNSICAFSRNNNFLDFYLYACERIVQNMPAPLSHTAIGTSFLTPHRFVLPLIQHSIVMSPLLLESLYREDEKLIAQYLEAFANPVYAINLSLTFRQQFYGGLEFTDAVYDQIIGSLIHRLVDRV
jgi:hypothetical protein